MIREHASPAVYLVSDDDASLTGQITSPNGACLPDPAKDDPTASPDERP